MARYRMVLWQREVKRCIITKARSGGCRLKNLPQKLYFICMACVLLLYFESSYLYELFRVKLFQLTYSYIPCTDASWPASSYDADTGCCGVCPHIYLSILEASINSQTVSRSVSFESLIHLSRLCLCMTLSYSAELRKPGQGFAWGQQWSPGAGPAQGVGSGRDNNTTIYDFGRGPWVHVNPVTPSCIRP
uniref:Uncharacterized protein n=1 Tax=Solanum demissum TaxID=50514 RepID=Q0KIR5_SOLDE|nr:hypothetical protein SDM1_32t00009 [Solanum demissum]